ncbi:MAG TPA: helix-turn-helix transcriptional regulator [Patescibacteria group bacterium]|nr:helix-turn-helix transcriptional regulator [Patescibacteria group bacterium]
MIRSRVLQEDGQVSLIRFDHPPGRRHDDPAEELSTWHSVSFIERGGFDLHRGDGRWRLHPAALFVTYPGFSYRCTHGASVPDDAGFSVQYAPVLVDDVQRTTGRHWTRSVPVAPLTNRLAYLRHRLLEAVGAGEGAMAATALAGELLAALDDSAATAARPFRPERVAWYARRVDLARELLASRFDEPLSLVQVAREAGMSPFHFSRVFRELVGMPPHRYLMRVRLLRAAQRLRAGAGVTDTCYATGFNNLSHFIRTFRRTLGVPPSRFGA